MATLAPSWARRFAIAAPMPRDAPVTSADLPLSVAISISSRGFGLFVELSLRNIDSVAGENDSGEGAFAPLTVPPWAIVLRSCGNFCRVALYSFQWLGAGGCR